MWNTSPARRRGNGDTVTGRITSADVAREAGLSRATVSYVLNRDPKQTIPEATRQRVYDAAAKLGYRPFGPARILRGARSTLVLMFTPGLEHASDFVAAGIVRQLGDALSERGLHLIWQFGSEDDAAIALDLAPAVVMSSSDEDGPLMQQLVREFSVPVIPAFPGLNDFLASSAVAQVQHLVGSGRRHLAYLGPDRAELQPSSEIRWNAVCASAHDLGIEEPRRAVLPSDRRQAREAILDLLRQEPTIDGICAYNDETAMIVLAAARDADIPVPGRVAVIGVDNHPFGQYAEPALSTVESDTSAFVVGFADMIAQIAAGEVAAPVRLPELTHIISRSSG